MMETQKSLFLEIKDADFQMWRHNPITSAYLRFLDDQAANFRNAAADLFEAGQLDTTRTDALNANVIRGRILALRELHALTLEELQGFYRQDEGENEGTTTQES